MYFPVPQQRAVLLTRRMVQTIQAIALEEKGQLGFNEGKKKGMTTIWLRRPREQTKQTSSDITSTRPTFSTVYCVLSLLSNCSQVKVCVSPKLLAFLYRTCSFLHPCPWKSGGYYNGRSRPILHPSYLKSGPPEVPEPAQKLSSISSFVFLILVIFEHKILYFFPFCQI